MIQDFTPLRQPDKTTADAPELARRRVGISAVVMLLGGGAALGLIPRAGQVTGRPTALPQNAVEPLPPGAAVATGVTDDMDFARAFATARHEVGPGGVFLWHGQPYNTFWLEEWTELSLAQRQEYAEMVLEAELPVRQAGALQLLTVSSAEQNRAAAGKPTVLEGYVAGQRVMGLDDDNDGVIDALVIAGDTTYKVVDRTGDEGLDTLYQYDPVAKEYRLLHTLAEPTRLTSTQLSGYLEEAMSRQIVNDIMGDDVPHRQPALHRAAPEADRFDNEAADESYINNADLYDMDDPDGGHGSE